MERNGIMNHGRELKATALRKALRIPCWVNIAQSKMRFPLIVLVFAALLSLAIEQTNKCWMDSQIEGRKASCSQVIIQSAYAIIKAINVCNKAR